MRGFVFFDIDDTLLDDSHATAAGARGFYTEHASRLPGPVDEFVRIWAEATARHIDRWMAGECSHQEQRRARLRDVWLGEPLSDVDADRIFEGYRRHYETSVRLFPDALPCLRALAGCSLGIISNGNPELQRTKLRNAGLQDFFRTVVISGDIGVEKPNARIFLEAARLAGCAPIECLYVGDRIETDALGAARAGMTGVWLNRDGREAKVPDGIPVIDGLEELSQLVKQWGTA